MWWFLLGVFIGVLFGILIVGLCAINQNQLPEWEEE